MRETRVAYQRHCPQSTKPTFQWASCFRNVKKTAKTSYVKLHHFFFAVCGGFAVGGVGGMTAKK